MGMDRFEHFFAEHYGPITRALAVAIGSSQEAEELAQEAFTRAYRRWPDVSRVERPATWVYVVAIREHGHRSSRAARRPHPLHARLTDQFVEVEDARDFAQRIQALPPRQRVAVVLRFQAGLSLQEIAEAMSCAVGTLKATLHAALRRLEVELEGDP